MKEFLQSPCRTPESEEHIRRSTEVLPRLLIALFLAVFMQAVLSRDILAAPEVRNAVRWTAYIGLFMGLAFLRLLRPGSSRFSWIEFFVLAFLAIALVSSLKSGRSVGSGVVTLGGFIGTYLIAFHVTTTACPEQTIALWTWSLLTVFAAVVLLSLACAPVYPDAFDGPRFQGITWNPNTLGSFAGLLMTGASARALERDARYRLGWFLLALAGVIALVLTQSRTAFIAAAAGLVVVALLRKNWLLVLGLVVVGALYAGAKSIATSIDLGDDTAVNVGVREVGFETRTDIWSEQLAIWLDEPWLGQGLQVDAASGRGRKGGEGTYLELLGGVGILGTVPLVLFWLIAAARLARWARWTQFQKEQPCRGYHLAATGIVVALLVHSIGEGCLAGFTEEESIYFWMIIGAACQVRLARPKSPRMGQVSWRERQPARTFVPV